MILRIAPGVLPGAGRLRGALRRSFQQRRRQGRPLRKAWQRCCPMLPHILGRCQSYKVLMYRTCPT
eukprot:12933755-Prorocentrum_lima.AAC.1